MKKLITKKRASKRPAVRVGRPPRDLAGEVDTRILEAAHQVFLDRGLAGASIDEIARLARAGKPTIYARFPTKEDLFMAVGSRNAASVRARFGEHSPSGTTVEERLVDLGTTILERLLVSETIDFMRISVTEAPRFPELTNVGRMAREQAGQAVLKVLSEIAASDEIAKLPAFAPQALAATTQFFMDLVVARLLMRALFGEALAPLRAEIGPHVSRSVAFFLDGCRASAH